MSLFEEKGAGPFVCGGGGWAVRRSVQDLVVPVHTIPPCPPASVREVASLAVLMADVVGKKKEIRTPE